MEHEMRAEYAEGGGTGEERPVKNWHMVRGEGTRAMCGRELGEGARTRSEADWGRTEEPFCHSCGALYLREVP
ncbi:hypothetical protein RM780_18480 [Streptomyces sp. DSM 44917]|uniref:GATA-type domain-containing protein n=1 Tax=Streptomyces boetiae TaxID=3075541 RepID=A0ABU2LCN4_9ACTN|nr:hypothetical protein [Streptomyces sp. DSM 44917]MDT0308933.1 hypothetical protein [Streptomyces sp. DSM 44917]